MVAQTFVVPLDGSPFAERALPVAHALAERVGGGLLLVAAPYRGVIEPGEYLSEVAARYTDIPVETRAHGAYLPADAILKSVGELDDRIACMTSHGRGRLRWSMLGSTAEEVVRRSDRPILLVGSRCRDDFLTPHARVLACVEGPESARRIAPVASDWADALGMAMNAAVVIHPRDIETIQHPEELLDPIVDAFGGREQVQTSLLRNTYVAGALADLAVDLPAGILVAGSHGRKGVERIVLGSVAMAILHLAACPLLVTQLT